MSGYTIGEIIVWLVLAAILGFILGWLLRQLKCQREHSTAERAAVTPAPAKAAALSSSTTVESAGFAKSAKPLAGGKAPSAEYTIKGNKDSMYFHTPDSRSYGQTIAEVWFKTEADARAAGFTAPGTGGGAAKKVAAKKASPAKKVAAKKVAVAAAPAAKKTTAKKATAKKVTVAAVPAAKKAPAAKKTATKTAAKKAPAKKAVAAGRFPGSAAPLPGGRAPSAQYKIKGNEDSMIYHTPDSPFYGQTIAETWFKTEAAAVAAGFRKPRNA